MSAAERCEKHDLIGCADCQPAQDQPRLATAAVSPAPSPRSFCAQLAVWGYAVYGDADVAALVAEGHVMRAGSWFWDRFASDLDGEMFARGDEPYRRVRDWAALPWLAEHCIRGHEEWPGL